MTRPAMPRLMSRIATTGHRTLLLELAGRLLGPLVAPKSTNPPTNAVLDAFYRNCQALHKPRVLELGTAQSIPGRSTRHDEWVPHAGEYLGTDIEAGADVDIVADVHRLTQYVGPESFDVIISCSTFEHFKYPHRAAHEIMKTLRVHGQLFIQTHQAYPLHAYPYDYFRFSEEGLAGLFGTGMGFTVYATGYEFPARIFSGKNHQGLWLRSQHAPAYLNVCLAGEKTGVTPVDYAYEYDAL